MSDVIQPLASFIVRTNSARFITVFEKFRSEPNQNFEGSFTEVVKLETVVFSGPTDIVAQNYALRERIKELEYTVARLSVLD